MRTGKESSERLEHEGPEKVVRDSRTVPGDEQGYRGNDNIQDTQPSCHLDPAESSEGFGSAA